MGRFLATKARVFSMRFARNVHWMTLAALVSTGGVALWEYYDWFELSEDELNNYDDGLTAFAAIEGRSDDIVIVAIDDRTFQTVSQNPSYAMNFGSWPYSRNIWAGVVEHLSDEGAVAIVFDAVVDEPHTDPSGDLAMAEVIAETKVPFYLGFSVVAATEDHPLPAVDPVNRPSWEAPPSPEPAGEEAEPVAPAAFPDDGAAFEDLLAGESASELFPSEEFPSDGFPDDGGEFVAADDAYPRATDLEVARALAFPVIASGGFELPDLSLPSDPSKMQYPIHPIGPLVPIVPGFGLVVPEEDGDGKLRRTRFAYTDGVNTYVTLPVAVAADLLGADRIELSPGRLLLGDREIRINEGGDAEINYGGTLDERFQTVSLAAVLDDWALRRAGEERRLPAGIFEGKIVLIGGFAVGTADVKPTPFETLSPSVVKQAATLQNLLDDSFIVQAPHSVSLGLAFLVAFSCLTVIVVLQSSWLEVLIPVFLFFSFYLVTGYFLGAANLHILSAMPTMSGEIACIMAVAFNHFILSDQRDRYRETFHNILDPERLDLFVEQRSLPLLSGERREVTAVAVVLLDLPALTLSRRKDPETIVGVLNLYRDAITSALLHAGGCIGRHAGSTVTCVFGAPLADARHAFRACEGALSVRRGVETLRERLEGRGLPQLRVGMGVHSRTMLVANVGSDRLVEYTPIGGEMDVTIELAEANEDRESVILLDRQTADLIEGEFELDAEGSVEFGDIVEQVCELVAQKQKCADRQPRGAMRRFLGRPLARISPQVLKMKGFRQSEVAATTESANKGETTS